METIDKPQYCTGKRPRSLPLQPFEHGQTLIRMAASDPKRTLTHASDLVISTSGWFSQGLLIRSCVAVMRVAVGAQGADRETGGGYDPPARACRYRVLSQLQKGLLGRAMAPAALIESRYT